MRDNALRVLIIATVALFALSAIGPATAMPAPTASPVGFAADIDHVVVIMMENHAYDNYFAGYCLKLSSVCNTTSNGIKPGTCEPQLNYTAPCIKPYNFTAMNLTTPDMWHLYNNTIADIDGGKMNGFYSAEKTQDPAGGLVPRLNPFGHYNGSTIPIYWDLAQEFGLGDNFHTSALSYSLPNHWDLLAGQAPQDGFQYPLTPGQEHPYLNQANDTRTVQDLLNNTDISWKYYDQALITYKAAIAIQPSNKLNGQTSAYSFWDPLAARYESYTPSYKSHFADTSQFLTDISDGSLSNISYVIPPGADSDHPPANITLGEKFVATIVDSIEFSPYWNNTAIFVTWDDYGGFYDHVAPPSPDTLGLSIRVPLLVISPYTPAGFVNQNLGYFQSILAFIEQRWHLGCLTSIDCGAPNLSHYFDFGMTPRSPIYFDPNWLNDTYPMRAPVAEHPTSFTAWWDGQNQTTVADLFVEDD